MKKGQPLIVAGIYQIFHTVIQSWCNPQFSNLINSNHNGNKRKGTCLLCEYLIVINKLQRTYIKTSKFAINIFYHVNISKKKKRKKKVK